MNGGGVLNFTHRTQFEFFRDDVGVNISDEKYNYASGSKANLVRGFWMVASDSLVSKFVSSIIAYIENQILIGDLSRADFPLALITRGYEIANSLIGIAPNKSTDIMSVKEDEFINREFKRLSLDALGLDSAITEILKQRLEEIRKCLNAKAPLSVIFLCGSSLEGILLGVATKYPEKFNRSVSAPKKDGKVLAFPNWTLSSFIDVGASISFLGEDVKKHSHALRDFMNYIHPYEQMTSDFSPHEHSAKISWQVLQAAIFELTSAMEKI